MIFDQALQAHSRLPVKSRYFAPTDPPRASIELSQHLGISRMIEKVGLSYIVGGANLKVCLCSNRS